jgi:hypothetical protein
VTSDGTEDFDRGDKLAHYRQIPSLEAVAIASHREPRVDVWWRAGYCSFGAWRAEAVILCEPFERLGRCERLPPRNHLADLWSV